MKKLLLLSRSFGLSLIVIFGSFLLSNCESSDEEFTYKEIQPKSSIEYLSLDQFKDQIKSAELLQALEPNFKLSNDALHYKKGKITILTDQILKYTKSGITTYTFRLSKNTSKSSDFENLLVHIKKDDSYQLALTKFKYKKASSGLPYSIVYKKINANKLSNIGVLDVLFAKQYVDGLLLDECVDVSYTCPYGGDSYHTSETCGPDGSGPGSTTILNFDPCFQDSGFDRGDSTDNDNSDTGEDTDDRDGGGGTGTGSGGVLEPPCGDSIHGCDKTDTQLIKEFKYYLQSIQYNSNWIRKSGTYKNRPSLRYTHLINLSNGDTQYLLSTGDQMLVSQSQRMLNYSSKSIIATSEENGPYHYLYAKQKRNWYELAINNVISNCLSCDLEYLIKQASTTALKLAGRYIVPIEDVLILIDGQDFDGGDASRALAASMILIEIVPGGKLLKPIANIAKGNKSWRILTKVGTKKTILTSKEIFAKLKTDPNTAYFYSGNSNGVQAWAKANEISKKKGGTTLERLLETQLISLPKFDPNDLSVIELWSQISESYAMQSSGEVTAIIGENVRIGNIWENIELPALLRNEKVTKIIKIDPETLVEEVILNR